MDRAARLKRRLEKIERIQERLRREAQRIEFRLSGGEGWKGTFAEIFGTAPAEWEGRLLVPECTYKREYCDNKIQGGYFASTFGGPQHCTFREGQMPVVMRGSMAHINKNRNYRDDEKALKRLARIKQLSLTCREDIVKAIEWARSKECDPRYWRRNYREVVGRAFGWLVDNERLEPKALLINGHVVSASTIGEAMRKRGANKKHDKAMRVAKRFKDAASRENGRPKTGRHEWASVLLGRAEKLWTYAWNIDKSDVIEREAESIFAELVKTGAIDSKLRKLMTQQVESRAVKDGHGL